MRFAPSAVRPFAVFAVIALGLTLSSCQCSWKPDVGPVDDEEGSVTAVHENEQVERGKAQAPTFGKTLAG
jgi:hypothetical protein